MKKFLTVLLVIAVMFTFSFSSAFAAVNYDTTVTDAKAAAYSAIESYVALADYASVQQEQVLSLLNGYEAEIAAVAASNALATVKVASIGDLVQAYKDAVDEIATTGTTLATAIEKAQKELEAYEALMHTVVAPYEGEDNTMATVLTAEGSTYVADFAAVKTQAQLDKMFVKWQGKIESAAKKVVDEDTTKATAAFKAEYVQKVREFAAQSSEKAGQLTSTTQLKINAAVEAAVAEINAAVSVGDVVDVYNKYCNNTGWYVKVKAHKGLVAEACEYGAIYTLLSKTELKVNNVETWEDLVQFWSQFYDSKEVINGEWDRFESALQAANAYAANGGTTEDTPSDMHKFLLGLTRGYHEADYTSLGTLAEDYDYDVDDIHYNWFIKADQKKAYIALENYWADVEAATSLAQVRALQDDLYAALSVLTLQDDYDLEQAKDTSYVVLDEFIKEWKKSNDEGKTTKTYNADAQAAIDVLYAAAKADIASAKKVEKLAQYVTVNNHEITKVAVAAENIATVATTTMSDLTAVEALKAVLKADGYVNSNPTINYVTADAGTIKALVCYYNGKLAADYGYDYNYAQASKGNMDKVKDVFHEESTNIYYTNYVNANAERLVGAFLTYGPTYGYAQSLISAYDTLAAQLDTYTLEVQYQAEKAYTAFEEAMKALADNAADKTVASKTRVDKALAAWTEIKDTNWSDYKYYYTADQKAALLAAPRTILDYKYEYEYAKGYTGTGMVAYVSEYSELFWQVYNAMYNNLDLYSYTDQAVIKKTLSAAYVTVQEAKTADEVKAAVETAVATLKALVPEDAAAVLEGYADSLATRQALAAKFFATYEGTTFASKAADELELRDEIIAAMDDDVTMDAEEVKVFLQENPLTVRTAKTAKGNIKVTVTTDLSKLEKAGYTVSYKFYKATKKNLLKNYSLALTKSTNTYTNTKLVKGANYYKAVVVVKDAKGAVVAESQLVACKAGYRTIK